MIVIGELINASRKVIKAAIESENASIIMDIAKQQDEAGADYIDVNAGIFVDDEPKYLSWLVQTVQNVTDKPCAIDSPNPRAIESAIDVHKGAPIINSISLEKDRYDSLLPLIVGTDCKVIALCMSDEGMPETMEDRLNIADSLISGLVKNGVQLENIFVDPLVQPLSVNKRFGVEFIESIEQIIKRYPGVHTACGLSNISYGLPARKFLNQAFMTMAIAKGLDGAIVNPLDTKMMAIIVVVEALAGRDNFCMNFLKSFRAGQFENC